MGSGLMRILKGPAPLLAAALACGPLRAEVPPDQAYDLYLHTRPELRHLSPFWGMAALKSGVLPNIRFFGAYTSKENPDFPLHPGLEAACNCPQDAIAGVIEWLFPSPDGVNFVHNERKHDPIGVIAREQRGNKGVGSGLFKIHALLEATVHYRRSLGDRAADPEASAETFRAAVVRILHRASSLDGDPGHERNFNKMRLDFARMMQRAVLRETAVGGRDYPADIVETALLAYAWKTADGAEELYQAFGPGPGMEGLLLASKAPAHPIVFDEAYYRRHLDDFRRRLEASESGPPDPGEVVAFLQAQQDFDSPLRDLLPYASARHGKTFYPDCGETSLRNFFNSVLGHGGVVDPALLDRLVPAPATSHEDKAASDPSNGFQRLKAYYAAYGPLACQWSGAARDCWGEVVADLNRPGDALPIVYAEKTFNLKGIGVGNMLNVIAHLLPEPRLQVPLPEGDGRLPAIAGKLDVLCELLSRTGAAFDWEVESGKELPGEIVAIQFLKNGKPLFTWSFSQRHFSLTAVGGGMDSWVQRTRFQATDPRVRSFLLPHSDISRSSPGTLSEIFAYDLREPEVAAQMISYAANPDWPSLPTLVLLVHRSIPLDTHVFPRAASAILRRKEALKAAGLYPLATLLERPEAEKTGLLASILMSVLDPMAPESGCNAARILLEHGADPNGRDSVGTPFLHIVLHKDPYNRSGLAPMLLAEGVDPNQTDFFGATALQIALLFGNGMLIPQLLEKGADPRIRDRDGDNAIDYFTDKGRLTKTRVPKNYRDLLIKAAAQADQPRPAKPATPESKGEAKSP